jgi:hypothetical protein
MDLLQGNYRCLYLFFSTRDAGTSKAYRSPSTPHAFFDGEAHCLSENLEFGVFYSMYADIGQLGLRGKSAVVVPLPLRVVEMIPSCGEEHGFEFPLGSPIASKILKQRSRGDFELPSELISCHLV